jgi:hypothetical protein
MEYKEIFIEKKCVKNEEELLKYLYDVLYNDIIHINENGSLHLYEDKSNNLYIESDLFAGYDIINLTNIVLPDNINIITDRYPFYKYYLDPESIYDDKKNLIFRMQTIYKIYGKSIKLDYIMFCKYVLYLLNWYGEYGYKIFEIKNEENVWKLNYYVRF